MIQPPPLQEYDEAERLVRMPVYSVGYHTRLRPPTLAHPVRESADYAMRCLASGEAAAEERGRQILDRILSLQVTDPTLPHFGIWGWFAEESPAQMAPADWNWADFIGVRLLEMIRRHEKQLTPELVARTWAAIDHAAWSIFRRNVGPGYTNICAMGAAVCLAWGEMLPEPRLLEYGAQRLHNMRRELEFNGGFPEYNSPNYGIVTLIELERVLQMVKHPAARADATAILERTWELIADQFHPGTAQWAGPQSRCYQDWLKTGQTAFLGTRIGLPLKARTPEDITAEPEDPFFPCPAKLRTRFTELPKSPLLHRQCWMKNEDGTPSVISTTWCTDDATLGSMNRETTWIQRRVVLGYWRTPEDSAVRTRLRLLHNGKDFASGFVWNQQEGPCVLTGFHFVTDQGDFHPSLDVPPGRVFHTRDLRIRYEVEGAGATASVIRPGVFELKAGTRKVIIHGGPIRFDGKESSGWTCGHENHLAWVEGILYSGPERDFLPSNAGESTAAAALELLSVDETASLDSIAESITSGHREFHWQPAGNHPVRVPVIADKRPLP